MKDFGVFFKRILYDPVKTRIIYDFVISFVIILLHDIIFSYYAVAHLPIFVVIMFPFGFVLFNTLFGVYSRYKVSTIFMKAYLLFASALCVMFLISLFTPISVTLFLSAVYVAVLATAPRVFFNFGSSFPKRGYVENLVRDNQPILVVGGGGYIGSKLVEKLLQKNYKVRVFDKFLYGQEVLGELRKNPNLELIQGDVSELYSLTLAVSGAQAVVHLAGLVGDPACAADAELTRHLNIVATRMLRESVKAFSIPRFIFASSCSVYGASPELVDEDSALHPVSLYAQTKIDAENEILRDGFDYFHPTILRFATVFGHSRKPRFDLVANLFVAQAYNDGVITVNGGDQWRPFVHVDDVASAIVRVLESPIERVSRQIFNVGSDSLNMTIEQVAETVAKIVTKDKKGRRVTIRNQGSNDKRNYHVSFQKIHRMLGYKTAVSAEQGIREILHAFERNVYTKPYTDRYYKNVEMTKDLIKEFHTEEYRKTHFSTFEIQKILRKRRAQQPKLVVQPFVSHDLGTVR
jgi:nucleoside-diphosphate-sugar epimerase